MIDQHACIRHLDNLNIDYQLVNHTAVYTIEQAMAELPGRTEIKNLFLQDDKGAKYYLVVMPGLKRLDLKNLSHTLDAKKLRFVNPVKLEAMLGVKPGSVSLFCCLREESKDIMIVIDKDLLQEKEIGFHPIVNTATVFMDQPGFKKLLAAMDQEVKYLDI